MQTLILFKFRARNDKFKFKFNEQIHGGKPSDDFIVDLKRLRLWLREMEKQLAQFPTISDAIKMKDFELEKLQKKNEVSGIVVVFALFFVLTHFNLSLSKKCHHFLTLCVI